MHFFYIWQLFYRYNKKTNSQIKISEQTVFGFRNHHSYFQYKGNEENECGVKEMALIEFLWIKGNIKSQR